MVLDTLPTLDPANTVRAWDLAASAQRGSSDPDWTVGLKLARDPVGRFVVLDVVRLRGEPHEVEQAILEAAGLDGRQIAVGLPQDPGAAGKSLVSYLATLLAGHRLMISRESGSKETRATPVAAQAGAGNLLLARAAWNRALLEELAAFPFGAKDDQVDALSRAFAMLIDQPQTARRLRSTHLAR